LHHGIDLIQDIVIGHTQHAVALLLKAALSVLVVVSPTDVTVAIDFDDELGLYTAEIDNVSIDGMLPAESGAKHLLASQTTPQQSFGECHPLAEFPGVCNERWRRPRL
jgi:hypothetical protein